MIWFNITYNQEKFHKIVWIFFSKTENYSLSQLIKITRNSKQNMYYITFPLPDPHKALLDHQNLFGTCAYYSRVKIQAEAPY
jgi:hypothetical protein